jgi:hypothetical protein
VRSAFESRTKVITYSGAKRLIDGRWTDGGRNNIAVSKPATGVVVSEPAHAGGRAIPSRHSLSSTALDGCAIGLMYGVVTG